MNPIRLLLRRMYINKLRKKAFGGPMTREEKREFYRQVAEVKAKDERKRAGEGGLF